MENTLKKIVKVNVWMFLSNRSVVGRSDWLFRCKEVIFYIFGTSLQLYIYTWAKYINCIQYFFLDVGLILELELEKNP